MAVAPVKTDDPERVGRYRIVGRLGQGGMGRVYLGLSPGGRPVAVKVVRDELAGDPGFRGRFVREVAAARLVAGFYTAEVVDADPDGDPPWLATRYVAGPSLEAAVAAHGPWPERSVRALGAALAEGLESVHGAGVVHRDLKPSNVLLAGDGPRLIDFGISLAAEGTQLTETGAVIGTPGFIAPEQLVRDEASAASDVFAFGAVLAFAATGSGPFGGGPAHALHYRVVHEPPDLAGLPSGLADVVGRCLAKDPEERPAVSELVAELGGAGDGPLPDAVAADIGRAEAAPVLVPAGAVAEPPAEPTAVDRRARAGWRRPLLAGVAVAATVSLVAAGAVLAARTSGDERDTAGPPAWKERWSFPLDGDLELVRVTESTVYLGDQDGTLVVLDAAGGAERWRKRYPGEYPALEEGSDEIAYYGDGTYTYALDARNGRELWKEKDHGITGPSSTVGSTTYKAFANWLFEIDARTGDKRWEKRTEDVMWDTPVAAGGTLYIVDGEAALHAVDAGTGDNLWRFDAGSEIETLPVAADGMVYIGTIDGAVHAVDADTGREAWSREFDGAEWDPALAEGAGYPIVAGGVVYFENDAYVCAFDAGTGELLWKHEPGPDKELVLLEAMDGQVLFNEVPDNDGDDENETVHALDARTGERLWTDVLGESTTIVGGTVYYEDGGRLRAVEAAG
ncbi:serine/threonine-protein kinase [Actinomadura sp. WAC 06369]|uniref:serine/threonine-protein kinase n=1 Tax=Actinomadura sp. WAC 06369 TaxID=2203193 RepID=UPI000F76C4E9|nr:serine/threonine-protein kinase [Actinomadura sp. WAC 06369]RSN64081.1 hypothetical protein DMH08_18490 [Actinomadura sp. WAC 06369]